MAELAGRSLVLGKRLNHFLRNQFHLLDCIALLISFRLDLCIICSQVKAYLLNASLQVEGTEAVGKTDSVGVAFRFDFLLLGFLLVNGGPNLVVLCEKA
jgi:hypothetical protein